MKKYTELDVNKLLEKQREEIALKLLFNYLSQLDEDVLKNICKDVIEYK